MRYYLTTAIPYVNAQPHLGFVLEIVQADAYARFLRMLGEEVYFVTGTDENSLKNVRSAKKLGIPVQQLVDRNSTKFKELKEVYHLSYDDFIRTTEERHKRGVAKLWKEVFDNGDIYKKEYQGLYCVGCEAFYKPEELINGLCPEHKTKPELVKEENYFFRLSRYQQQLENLIIQEQLKVVPEIRKNEMLSFIKQGLEDFSISRSQKRAAGWGIPVPGDDSQVIYVWFDALANYITALGYADNSPLFHQWWEGADQIIHFIGKGITRFHAIYWPAILLAAQLRLPSVIFVHGYLTTQGEKISKSKGGAIDPFAISKEYDPEVIRYFLLREISPVEDGDFSRERLKERYNSELAEGLGNLLSRVLTLGEKWGKDIHCSLLDKEVENLRTSIWREYQQSFTQFRFNEALEKSNYLVTWANRYLSQTKPWENIKEAEKKLANLVLLLGDISRMLSPVMPLFSQKILSFLSLDKNSPEEWNKLQVRLHKISPLFPRIK